jgi:ribosome biogenesis GTPase
VADVAARAATISRRDPSQPRREQVLVANVDAVLVVASAAQPDLTPRLIDRFLVAAESRGPHAAVAINKTDLDPDRGYEEVAAVYRELDYEVFPCSAATDQGLDAIRAFLADRTTAMFGHSGVGKSTLANALDPSLELRTGEVHEATGKGMHTTTTVSLLRLPWGGYLVDTPGIREFGLWKIEPADLGIWFREIAARTDACRFNDCVHEAEPGCAVKAAVEAGEIARWRYESYLSILESLRADTLPDY